MPMGNADGDAIIRVHVNSVAASAAVGDCHYVVSVAVGTTVVVASTVITYVCQCCGYWCE